MNESSHFGPKHSEYTEICKFRRAMKNKHETVSEYTMRLRNLAQHCKFDGLLEKEIERQFVVGCGMPEVERKCVRADDLDLKKLLELALGYERSEKCIKGLHTYTEGEMPRGMNINYTRQGDAMKRYGDEPKCRKCGRYEHKEGFTCPAKDKECKTCGKIGHFSSVCWQDSSKRGTTYKEKEGTTFKERNGSTSNFKKYGSDKYNKKWPEKKGKGVNNLQRNVSWQADMTADELNALERYKEGRDSGLFMIKEITKQNKIARITENDLVKARVRTVGELITYLVDTGSPINVIDEGPYERMVNKPILEPCEQKFYGFTAVTPISMLSKFKTKLQFKKTDTNKILGRKLIF